jgi:hypothetical protein
VRADQRGQPGRVDEGDAAQVEQDVAVDGVGGELVQLGFEHERAGHVQLAVESHHGVIPVTLGAGAEVFEGHRS